MFKFARMNDQTRIIVAVATVLTVVDLTGRALIASRTSPSPVTSVNMTDTLVARNIRLVDNSGNVRMEIRTDESDEPGLHMYDRTGVQRLQLDTYQQVPSLILNAPDGHRSTYFGMDTEGKSILNMNDENGNPLASMDVSGSSSRVFFNREGETLTVR